MKNVLLGICLFLSHFLFAQQILQTAPPGESGFNASRLERIDAVVKQYIDSQWIAGATAIVVRNGKVVYHKAFGYANVATKKPQKVDDIFRIASQTKAIVSTGIMMLYEEGKFLLDDPLAKYMPVFAQLQVLDKFNPEDTTWTTVKPKRPVTIRDLLTHTSGIGYAQIGSPEANAMFAKAGVHAQLGIAKDDWRDQVNRIASVPLLHQPGEKWTYGLNSDILGYLIQTITGQSLGDFLHTRIFAPLGMQDTWFYLPKEKHNRLVALHTENDFGKVEVLDGTRPPWGKQTPDYPLQQGNLFSGGGGLVSTAYDYAIFMQTMLNGGTYNGVRIISRNSVDMMTSNQLGTVSRGLYEKFGLGFGIATQDGATRFGQGVGTYSWGGAFSSSYWIDPEEKIVAQFFLNQFPSSHGDIHSKFKALVYSAIE